MKQAYYLEPDKVGRKAFYLLKQVLEDEGLTAICKVVIKDREALAAIDPFDDTMLLTTLHWPDEIRSTEELDLPDEELEFKPAEIADGRAARRGDDRRVRPEPSTRTSTARRSMKVIEAKVEGRETVEVEEPEESGKLVDLMAALEASVSAATASRKEPVSVSEAKAARAQRAREGREGQARGSPKHREGEERRGRGGRRVRIAPQAQVVLVQPATGCGPSRVSAPTLCAPKPVRIGIGPERLRTVQVQFLRHIRDVAADREDTDADRAPDLRRALAIGHEAEDLSLARRQSAAALLPVDEIVHDRGRDGTVNVALVADDSAHGSEQVGRDGALHHVPLGACE